MPSLNKLLIIVSIAFAVFVHYELSLERDLKLKLFCETKSAQDIVASYGPECYTFMQTAF